MTHPRDEELVQFTDADTRVAFDRAIAAGVLSADEGAENFAGNFTFRGTEAEGDEFRHILTTQRIYNKVGDAS